MYRVITYTDRNVVATATSYRQADAIAEELSRTSRVLHVVELRLD